MAAFEVVAASPPPAPFTRRPRTLGPPVQVQLHATRGVALPEDRQLEATLHWFASTAPYPAGNSRDGGAWGASADFVIGPDARRGGAIAVVACGDWLRTFGSWSAGYGPGGPALEHGAAERGVAIELAQARPDDDFDPRTVEAAAWLCREVIDPALRAAGAPPIPARRIPSWSQRLDAPVPAGYIGHEDLANGRKLGKTDPGPRFPWSRFLRLVAADEARPRPLREAISQAELERRALAAYWGVAPHRGTFWLDGADEVIEIRSPRA